MFAQTLMNTYDQTRLRICFHAIHSPPNEVHILHKSRSPDLALARRSPHGHVLYSRPSPASARRQNEEHVHLMKDAPVLVFDME